MRGEFTVKNGLIIPNSVVAEGEETYLKMLCQDDQTRVAGGGNFYVGVCSDLLVTNATVLADLTEPTTGGYSRQPVARSAVGWPSIVATADGYKANTATVTFSATGADYDQAFARFFLATTADNTGQLLAISGALPSAVTLLNGETYPVSYALYLR